MLANSTTGKGLPFLGKFLTMNSAWGAGRVQRNAALSSATLFRCMKISIMEDWESILSPLCCRDLPAMPELME